MLARLIRSFLLTLALLGFLGQTAAQAVPWAFTNMEPSGATSSTMADCTSMEGMASDDSQPAPADSCTLDCIAKMGCVVPPVLPERIVVGFSPIHYDRVSYTTIGATHEGRAVEPELFPPIALT